MHSTSTESKTTVLKSSIYSESTDSEWPAATVPQQASPTCKNKRSYTNSAFMHLSRGTQLLAQIFVLLSFYTCIYFADQCLYIHSSLQNTTLPTHTYISSYKRFITWCNGVPGEQRELVIKYRSVNVTVFNTMAAVMLFLFLFGLNCHPRSARYGRVCVTPHHPHWLCMTECFTFKNLIQRPLSL